MATPRQALYAQLSAAHWTCQQMPEGSRVRIRIMQLLEVALDFTTCADLVPMPPVSAAAPAGAQTQFGQPAQQSFPQAPVSGMCFKTAGSCSWRSYRRQGKSRARGTAWREEHCPPRSCGPSTSHPSSQGGCPAVPGSGACTGPDVDSPAVQHDGAAAGAAAGHKAAAAACRFAAFEAELLGSAGLSREQAGTIAAAVHALASPYERVLTAAVQKLQGITANWPDPAAVSAALLEVDAVQALTDLLSSACRTAAAGTLCNISWYAAPRAAMLAAGAVPMLVAMLWDEQQECRIEAAHALSALTSTHDEAACAAIEAAGGIPRLVGLLAPVASRNGTVHCTSDSTISQEPAERKKCNGESSAGSNSASDNSPGGSSCTQQTPDLASTGSPQDHDTVPGGLSSCVEVAAAVTALGNLAAGSAARRGAIATTGKALQHIVGCLGSDDAVCRGAALQALQHITQRGVWRLSDSMVVAQVKAAGALEVLLALERSEDRCEQWEALRLKVQLQAPTHPCIAFQELIGAEHSAA